MKNETSLNPCPIVTNKILLVALRMHKKHFIILFAICIISNTVKAQQSGYETLNSLAAKLVTTVDNSASLYVHLDKTVHSAGGTIWCKGYLVQQSNRIPITSPTTVYIDLVNGADSIISHLILESGDLKLEAAIPIPYKLSPGYYTIRAYTSEMVKNNPNGIFYSPVYITNTGSSASVESINCFQASTGKAPVEEIQIIPEGNWLINGIDNKVAVLSFNKQGIPVPIAGIVKDNRDSIVASFKTGANGSTTFFLQPVKTRKYKAIITKEGAIWKEINLPDAPINAYQLAITKEDASNIYARIGLSDLLYTKTPVSYLIGMSKGRICFSAMGKGMYAVTIPKKNFPAGIAEFFLFDEKQELVSRRKIYTGLESTTVKLETDKKEYMGRSTVKLSVTITDTAGKAVPALLSVSVTDQKMVPYYFAPSFPNYSEKSNATLFLQNRFPYKDLTATEKESLLIADNSPLALKPAQKSESDTTIDIPGITIKGHLLKSDNEPVANQPISLMSEQQRNILLFDTTDNTGYFEFRKARFYDSTLFFIYSDTKNQKVADWKISLENDKNIFQDNSSSEKYCVTDSSILQNIKSYTKSNADSFLTGNTRAWLAEVSIKSSSKKGKSDNPKNRFSNIITREQLSKLNLSSMANAIKMLPGVIMIGNQLTLRGGMQGIDNSAGADLEPMVVVDGVPAKISSGGVTDYLNSFNPDNIDYIEVLKGPEAAFYASRSGNGVIVIKTGLPGNYSSKQNNMKGFYPAGFHFAPEFYQPNYQIDAVREAQFSDNRSTIYWNGHLQTDENGKTQVQFFTADPRSTYLITLTGITSKGEIIYKQLTISRN